MENLVPLLLIVIGAVVGSFLNVVIVRLPQPGGSLLFPASHCPGCRTPIRWYDNVPVLSFILLKGRCRACGRAISWQYPVVELAMALITLALYHRFGLSAGLAIFFYYCAALLAVVFIDLEHQLIPDLITLPGIAAGLALSFFNPLVTWQQSAIGLVAGGGILYAIAAGYYLLTKRIGMGGGDIKLLAMIGAFQGWQALPFVILASSLTGIVAGIGAMLHQKKGGKTAIPYGPFLALGSLLYLFFEERIHYYLLVLLRPA